MNIEIGKKEIPSEVLEFLNDHAGEWARSSSHHAALQPAIKKAVFYGLKTGMCISYGEEDKQQNKAPDPIAMIHEEREIAHQKQVKKMQEQLEAKDKEIAQLKKAIAPEAEGAKEKKKAASTKK